MAIVKTYDLSDFIEDFKRYGRDYFSYEGYLWMYEMINECYCESNFEMDVIALCCDFNEEEVKYIIDKYSCMSEWYNSFEDVEDMPSIEDICEKLNDYTIASITTGNMIIYHTF